MPLASPQLDDSSAAALARAAFGIDGKASPLPSYLDTNYRIDAAGRRTILRVAHAGEDERALAFQHRILDHLQASLVPAPTIVRTHDGRDIVPVEIDGEVRFARMHTWIEGTPLATREVTLPLLEDLGAFLGRLDIALAKLPEGVAALAPSEHPWDLARSATHLEHAAVHPAGRRERIELTLARFGEEVAPRLAFLPEIVVHNDANDHNVLVSEAGSVAGLTDFGDALVSPAVCEVAIAATYAMMPASVDPDAACRAVVEGFAREYALSDDERELVPDLVEARLAVSVTTSARSRADRPGNDYASVSEAPAWRLLDRLENGGRARLRAALARTS